MECYIWDIYMDICMEYRVSHRVSHLFMVFLTFSPTA